MRENVSFISGSQSSKRNEETFVKAHPSPTISQCLTKKQPRKDSTINEVPTPLEQLHHLPQLPHRHMNQPLLPNPPLRQQLHAQGPIPILHHLLRHRLSDPGPRRLRNPLPSMQQPEIVPHVQIARLEIQVELVRRAAEDALELQVRAPGGLVGDVGGQERAGQVRVPAETLEGVGRGFCFFFAIFFAVFLAGRVRGYGDVDDGLVERDAGVEARQAAHCRGRTVEVGIQRRVFLAHGVQGGGDADPGVVAGAFEAVEAHYLDGVFEEGVVAVGEEELRGIVVGDAEAAGGVVGVGRDVEGLVVAADRVDVDGGEEAFEDVGDKIVVVGAFGGEGGDGEVGDLDDAG